MRGLGFSGRLRTTARRIRIGNGNDGRSRASSWRFRDRDEGRIGTTGDWMMRATGWRSRNRNREDWMMMAAGWRRGRKRDDEWGIRTTGWRSRTGRTRRGDYRRVRTTRRRSRTGRNRRLRVWRFGRGIRGTFGRVSPSPALTPTVFDADAFHQ